MDMGWVKRPVGFAVTSRALMPSLERPMPTRGRRRPRISAAFSTMASAATTVREVPRRRSSASNVASASTGAVIVVRRWFTIHEYHDRCDSPAHDDGAPRLGPPPITRCRSAAHAPDSAPLVGSPSGRASMTST